MGHVSNKPDQQRHFMPLSMPVRNISDYVYDRVSGHFKLPSLADLIAQKAQALTA